MNISFQPYCTACAVLALLLTIMVAGCTAPGPGTSSSGVAPIPAPAAPADTIPASETITQTMQPTTTPTPVRYATYTNPVYGLTIQYPENWEVQEVFEYALRDYGRTTLNIVNFYTPDEGYAVFSVDIDSPTSTAIEDYFNYAVLAHQEYYGSAWEITKHNYQMHVSNLPSYRLDFMVDKKTAQGDDYGIQVYTYAQNTPYIFTFKGPEFAYKDHLGEMLEILKHTTIESVADVKTRY